MIPKVPYVEANGLCSLLPAGQFRDQCETQSFSTGDTLVSPETPIEHVYFPTSAVLSIMSVMADRSKLETAVTGNEGLAPIAAFHKVPTSTEQIIVQVPGDVLRLPLSLFRQAMDELPEFRSALHRFSMALFTQAAQTSGCNRKHSVIQRCARWLLQTHDRVRGDGFQLTHLFLSQMLGVRRSSVTVAAESLRSIGAISYTRGTIHVDDRRRLESSSCECYAILRGVYDRLLGDRALLNPMEMLMLSGEVPPLAQAAVASTTVRRYQRQLQAGPPQG